jgi:hypothetical protein
VEGLNREGQWIIMMGFLVSLGIFFLALVISQSTLVGQTTAEGVLEFPKNDIQDLRREILEIEKFERVKAPGGKVMDDIQQSIRNISLSRLNTNVWYNLSPYDCFVGKRAVNIHYNNGVTVYNETTYVYYIPC